MKYDVAIVGAGPAGSSCAAVCAEAGLRVAIVERVAFPREKVCGDCVNPACWPVLDRLGVTDRVLELPHARLASLEFIGTDAAPRQFPLPSDARGEIAVKRSAFDDLLLTRARELGATLHAGEAVTALEKPGTAEGWRLRVGDGTIVAETLVAADGRNSTVARLLGLLPPARKDRLGLQTHLPRDGWAGRVAMRLLPFGYCGVADVGAGEINLCLVAPPRDLARLKAWAEAEFAVPADHAWRTIAPLERAPLAPVHGRLLLVGDAARVVEPFTGEGIYYALASGLRAGEAIVAGNPADYAARHGELYRGRLWVNDLARAAVLHPRLTTAAMRLCPSILGRLTAKVVGASAH